MKSRNSPSHNSLKDTIMYTINFDHKVAAEHNIGFNKILFDQLADEAAVEVIASCDQLLLVLIYGSQFNITLGAGEVLTISAFIGGGGEAKVLRADGNLEYLEPSNHYDNSRIEVSYCLMY